MSLLLRRPWATQPRGPTSIASNPAAHGLVHCWLYGNAGTQDLATGKLVPWSTPGNAKPSAGSLGPSVENSSGMRQVTPISGVSGDVSWSARWVFEAASLSALQALYRNGSGTSFGLYIDGAAGTKILKFYGGASFTTPTSVTGLVNGGTYDVVVVKTASAPGIDLYINGKFENTLNTSGASNLAPQLSDFWGDSFSQNVIGKKYLLQVWNRVLTADEILQNYYAPWAVFRPRRIWVPVSAGGGGSHDATGAMSAQSATVSGAAAAVATYTSSGALTAQAATVAGTANHVTTHASSGVLEAQAATVAGSATHVAVHGSTGVLEAQAATVSGSADHSAAGAFSATGALTAQAAVVAGSAAHLTLHTATGALASGSAAAAGSAVHYTLHTAAGDLVADAASVGGAALHSGDGAEVAKPFTGAGRPRRTRQRVVVEIDGEDFIAASSEEAQAILDQAKEAAEEKAKVAIERATKARSRPTRKVLADARKSLELPEISAPGLDGYAEEISRQIEGIYQSAIQTIEVAALLRKRELAEEDDEDILMLIA